MSRYSGPENALIEGEQECRPHVVRVLEGIQQHYGVRYQIHFTLFYLHLIGLEQEIKQGKWLQCVNSELLIYQ